MPTPEQIEGAVRSYIDSYNAADLDAIVDVFAEDAVVTDPVGTPPKTGQDEFREFFAAGVSMGAKLTLDGPIRVAEEHAAFPFHVMLEWEGKQQRIDVIDVFKVNDDGKVIEMTAYFGPTNMGAP